ncbi:Uma2 family endonuclease [Aureimonas sp. ME7]|uniref:Uma2 family endonuclease n=1 Tax=Aureimonas sp. ME7 TaxID=2744252 RepID=UPI0015F41AFA|nr:Uma2 family endonuclease [Aureimonas sp. ME7]
MSHAKREGWSLPEFLDWERGQDRRYELVDGEALLMAGGTQAHALIAANLVAVLRPFLRGTPCRPSGSDLRIPIPSTGNLRYPDVTIDCGRFDPASHDASDPRIVFEVLSQSTGWYDQTRKLRDYEAVSSIHQYICVSQSEARVSIWLRDGEHRFKAQDDVLDGAIALALGEAMPMIWLRQIYEGLPFMAPPSEVEGV